MTMMRCSEKCRKQEKLDWQKQKEEEKKKKKRKK